jgi:hypothetical protein
MYRVASCSNRVIELNQKILILSKVLTKNDYILTIKLNSWSTDPFKLNVILNREDKISDVSCCILFYSCDWNKSNNVNFIKISDEKFCFYFDIKSEFLINRSLQVECHLKQIILILSTFLTRNDFYVTMTTELFIKYFCNINLCCLWRFNDKMSVIYWEIVCV